MSLNRFLAKVIRDHLVLIILFESFSEHFRVFEHCIREI
jgi:hypothetical protein